MALQYLSGRISSFDPFKRFYLTAGQQPDYSHRLSDDILLQIAYSLSIPDLLAMRLASRRFHGITYTPAIWKRLIKDPELQIPPLPPSTSSAFRNIKPVVCEQALRRAIAVDHEWQKKECRPAHNFFDSKNPTHCMAIVPGGRFLVTCYTEVTTDQTFLSIWDLEVPNDRPFLPSKRRAALIRTSLPGEAFELIAKYLPYKGVPGIATAVAGTVKRHNEKARFWAVYWTPLDILEEYSQACSKDKISVSQLQALADDGDGPFRTLAKKFTDSTISCLCLESIRGKPLVSVVRDASEIVLQDLETGIRSFVIPLDPWNEDNDAAPPWRNRKDIIIRMVKVLPAQSQLLVIREVRHNPPVWPVFWYEVYDLPPPGTRMENAMYTMTFQEADVKSIDFFECSENFYRNDSGLFDHSVNQRSSQRVPTEISIWAVNTGTTASDGFVSVILRRLKPVAHRAMEGSTEIETYSYCFDPLRVRFPGDRPVAISGGAQRGLWFLPPRDKNKVSAEMDRDHHRRRVGDIVRYLPTEMDPEKAPPEELQKELVTVKLPPLLSKGLDVGMSAYAFDESIGRLVLATSGESLIHVLDFSERVGIGYDV